MRKVAGLERHGYVFCMRGVTCFIHAEAHGSYGFHPVGGGDTEKKEELHFMVDVDFAFQFCNLPSTGRGVPLRPRYNWVVGEPGRFKVL